MHTLRAHISTDLCHITTCLNHSSYKCKPYSLSIFTLEVKLNSSDIHLSNDSAPDNLHSKVKT